MSETPTKPVDAADRSLGLILAAIVVLLPLAFRLDMADQFELPKLILLRVLTSLGLAVLLAGWVLRRRVEWRSTPLDLPLAVWGLWHLIKTVHSYAPAVSWRGEYENFAGSLTQLNYLLLFYMTTQWARNWHRASMLLSAFLASCVAVSVYALMQSLNLDFIGWASNSVINDRYFASLGNPNFLGALMLMGLAVAGAWLSSKEILSGRKAVALLWGGMLAGTLLWTLIMPQMVDDAKPLPLSRLINGGDRNFPSFLIAWFGLGSLFAVPLLLIKHKVSWARNLLLASTIAAMTVALFNTGTRGAFLGLIAGASVLFALLLHWQLRRPVDQRPAWLNQNPRKRLALAGAGALVLFLSIAWLAMPKATLDRFRWSLTHPAEAMDQSRWQIWGPGLEMIKDHPLTGTGVDTYKTVFPRYAGSKFAKFDGENVSSRTAHSEPLHIAATLGLIGLAIWIWLLARWAMDWWRAWKKQEGRSQAIPVLLALGALWTAYLVQNLVSFGVAAITAPFHVSLALLYAGGPATRHHLPVKQGLRSALAFLSLLCVTALPWQATRVFEADRHYNFGHMVTNQARQSASLGASDALGIADFAYQQLKQRVSEYPPLAKQELDTWERFYVPLRQAALADPSGIQRHRANLVRAAEGLLFLFSAMRQEAAVDLCPGEVKYHVFLGLAYEELYKRSLSAESAERTFEQALKSYQRGVELNPENAYYYGNLGRLYSLAANRAGDTALKESERYYNEAIKRAAVTPLFYENLVLVYGRFNMVDSIMSLCAKAEEADPIIGGRVYFSAGGVMFQAYRDHAEGRRSVDETTAEKLKDQALAAMTKAATLNPKRADTQHNLAVYYVVLGDLSKAAVHLAEALKRDPNYTLSRNLARDLKIQIPQPSP